MKNYSRTKSGAEESLEQWRVAHTTPTLGENHDQEEHNYDHHLIRKSVLSKVKDKAMIWRRITKRHTYNDASTPEWGVSLQDDEFDDDDDHRHFAIPIDDQSKMAPEKIKGAAKQQPRSIPVVYQRHVLDNRSCDKLPVDPEPEDDDRYHDHQQIPAPRTLTRSVTEKLVAPAYAVVSGAQKIVAMLQDVVVSSTSVASAAWEGTSSSLQQIMDKGVSVVKENVVEKLDPPEEEKTTISKKIPNDTGVREKVKEAVSSILDNELKSEATSASSNVASTNMSRSPVTTTNAREVAEEKNHERILQPN